jgi:predicted NBD/HSP70 family sugar kinase
MAGLLAANGELTAADVTLAADRGDPAARALLARASRLVGATLATLVSFYNPAELVLGGGIARAKEHVLDTIREAIGRRALPLATQNLRIDVAALPEELSGVTGAVHLALDEVFSAASLETWLAAGSPRMPAPH